MLFFYIIDLVINVLIFGGFAFRYKQTSVKYYLYLALAVLGFAVSDALLAFLGDSLNLLIVIVYVSLILVMLCGLVFVLVVLHMLQTWIHSMRNAASPAANKLSTSSKLIRILRIAYPSLIVLMVVFFVLLIFTTVVPSALALIFGLIYSLCVIAQLAVEIWMWLDIQSVSNESQIRKRNQLIRLAGLTFFSSWPSLLGGVGAGIGMSVCWWIWYGIALWPNALVGYDVEPQPDGQQQGGMGNVYAVPGQNPYAKGPGEV
jgi:hypothetical protein